ncbi:hypothetical protein Glove_197g107 [Diversispora epigaea]|uniref:Uncharacterized protein n=1 Tax=Diversispora epigaea TaxID=1348612 RepID=A0A397INR3_9GLOM|nr:hypothetical protein Glove_197g107 [Diversispora epigaea]
MKPTLVSRIKEICEKFVANFIVRNYQNIAPEKLIYNGFWKESEEKIANIVKKIFIFLKDIWINPVFTSDFAKSLNEGTYQFSVIFLLIQTILKNLSFRLFSFISTLKYQSIASVDRKGKIERKPDIMYMMDDEIKLWYECNDDIYYVQKLLNQKKNNLK